MVPRSHDEDLRLMEANIKNVDAVLQLLDARIPMSSLNPEIQRITEQKPRLYVMNKADLADPALTAAWVKYFRDSGAGCVAISAKQKGSAAQVRTAIEKELEDLIARRAIKGMGGARIRVMVVGIPNVGKSTFINNFAGQVRAKAADRPGVTRGKQWVTVGNYDLLDMPGVLWKKFDSLETATNLAFIGSIKDDILDVETLGCKLMELLAEQAPQTIIDRYSIAIPEEECDFLGYELLQQAGRRRGFLLRGGEIDTERMARILLDEFRGGVLGRITLEKPE